MTTVKEGVAFELTIDAKQAKAELAAAEASAKTFGGAADKLGASIGHVETTLKTSTASIEAQSTAVKKASESLGQYDSHILEHQRLLQTTADAGSESVRRLNQQGAASRDAALGLTKTTAAIEEVGYTTPRTVSRLGAMHSALDRFDRSGPATEKALRSMQFAVGGLGAKASETAGIVGDFAGFLLAGGGWGLALAAASTAAGLFTQKLEAMSAAEEKAFKAAWQTTDAIEAATMGIRKRSSELFAELNPRTLKDDVKEAYAAIEANEKKILDLRTKLKDKSILGTEQADIISRDIASIQRQNKYLAEQANLIEGVGRARAKVGAASSAGAPGKAQPLYTFVEDRGDDLLAVDEADRKRDDALYAQAVRDREKIQEEHLREMDRMEEESIAHQKKMREEAAAAQQRLAEENARTLTGYAMTGVGILQSASQQMIADLVSGQDAATENFFYAVSQQTGQALVGIGTRLLGESIFSALTPGGQPLAVAQVAGAAGLIAAGTAIGGVSMGLQASAGAAQISQTSTDNARTDPGVNQGRGLGSSSGGGGGGNSFFVYYGAGGPHPEDMARNLADVQREQRRRGL